MITHLRCLQDARPQAAVDRHCHRQDEGEAGSAVPAYPQSPRRVRRKPLQCVFLLPALQSCVSLLPHPLIRSYIYNSDSLSPSRPNAAIYSPSYSAAHHLLIPHVPHPTSFSTDTYSITTDSQTEGVNGLPWRAFLEGSCCLHSSNQPQGFGERRA